MWSHQQFAHDRFLTYEISLFTNTLPIAIHEHAPEALAERCCLFINKYYLVIVRTAILGSFRHIKLRQISLA